MVSKAQKRASENYLKKFDTIIIRVPKGRKAAIKVHAEQLGISLNTYLNRLIDRDMGPDD